MSASPAAYQDCLLLQPAILAANLEFDVGILDYSKQQGQMV
ncbi:hypothetical protein BJP36_36225 [Moorena producens JHB]|uniref:Uncharacterized protein n=1 Tax=Moorena producens (strain JHB) TaxID=1454205 RepID=A0A9Q9UW67_MOOP1|nr:hypothetical protein [Moorena producens]WAN69541.1 hypothetical protein BJP36_36225 [Moorena producens JHB]